MPLKRESTANSAGLALALSVALHLVLIGLPLVLGQGTERRDRQIRLASAAARTVSFRVSLHKPRPAESRTGRRRAAKAISQGARRPQRRFNSDVIWKHTAQVLGSITYPRTARRMGWEGTVSVRALVGPDGRVISVRVTTTSGHAILDRAALTGVRKHRFTPGAHSEHVTLRLRFELRR